MNSDAVRVTIVSWWSLSNRRIKPERTYGWEVLILWVLHNVFYVSRENVIWIYHLKFFARERSRMTNLLWPRGSKTCKTKWIKSCLGRTSLFAGLCMVSSSAKSLTWYQSDQKLLRISSKNRSESKTRAEKNRHYYSTYRSRNFLKGQTFWTLEVECCWVTTKLLSYFNTCILKIFSVLRLKTHWENTKLKSRENYVSFRAENVQSLAWKNLAPLVYNQELSV